MSFDGGKALYNQMLWRTILSTLQAKGATIEQPIVEAIETGSVNVLRIMCCNVFFILRHFHD